MAGEILLRSICDTRLSLTPATISRFVREGVTRESSDTLVIGLREYRVGEIITCTSRGRVARSRAYRLSRTPQIRRAKSSSRERATSKTFTSEGEAPSIPHAMFDTSEIPSTRIPT